MSSMRIAFDVSQTCQQRAGCAWFADSMAHALTEIPGSHQLFLYHHFDTWINDNTRDGTRINKPGVSAPFQDMTSAQAHAFWEQMRAEAAELPGKPDIVHSNNFCAPRLSQAKLVYTLYDLSFWARPEYTTEANRIACQKGLMQGLENADAFVFISEFSKKEFHRLLPGYFERTGKPSAVIYPAARGARATAISESPGNFWLSVGSLEPRKNYAALLAAVELYWNRSANPKPLWICGGSGWLSGDLHEKIQTLGKEGKVRHMNYLPDDELERLYKNAFGLLFPSFYEGFGLPVVEAMSHGCPVICSSASCLPEIGGQAAAYIRPDHPEDLVSAMLAWEQQPSVRQNFVQRGLDHSSKFSWQKSARDLLLFYTKILTS